LGVFSLKNALFATLSRVSKSATTQSGRASGAYLSRPLSAGIVRGLFSLKREETG
jgi:hypothetical protein